MIIDVSEIKRQKGAKLEEEFSLSCSELGLGGLEPQCLEPVHVQAVVTNTGQNLNVRGHVDSSLELTCSRCLQPFVYDLQGAFSEEFYSKGSERHKQWVKRQREPGNHPAEEQIRFYSNNSLDLTEVVRDAFFLALPMKMLCRPECRGICPICGQDRNEHPCDCEVDEVDSRWAALQKLLNGEE